MPMHPNECRFAAKILKICVHARASVSDGTMRGRDYDPEVNSVSESLEINLESFIFFLRIKIVSLIAATKVADIEKFITYRRIVDS